MLVSREIRSERENKVWCQDLFVTLTALGPLTTNTPKETDSWLAQNYDGNDACTG